MQALIQRVSEAQVTVSGERVADIRKGLLVLLGVEHSDDEAKARRLAERVMGYRIFDDAAGKMNLDLCDVAGELLVVSQFTLAADTRKGRRPSFSTAAHPDEAKRLYLAFLEASRERLGLRVQSGQFGADMQVGLVNDGPVTFCLTV